MAFGVLVAACGDGASVPLGEEPTRCEPSAGGPYWLLEGETVSFEVKCGTGLVLGGEAFTVGPLPKGAVYDAATRRVTFTPGLDQAAVYWLDVAVPKMAESTRTEIGVADAFANDANVPVVDPSAYPEEYGLPVIFISPRPKTESYEAVTVVYRGQTHTARAKLRGETSLDYPKNSYTIDFAKDDPLDDPAEAGGFEGRQKIALVSTFDDNSYIRQRLSYDLWNRLDPRHIQIKTYSAVVYLDGRYWGLYTVADHVDEPLMTRNGLAKGGNLYKAVSHDANFGLLTFEDPGGLPKTTMHDGYTKKSGLPLEGDPMAFADLDALVSLVATSDSITFSSEIGKKIDMQDYTDWWIFATFLMAADSAGKNSYHYRAPDAEVFRYAPWDFNASLGQNWKTERSAADGFVDYVNMSRLFERFLAEPSIAGPMLARYGDVLHGAFSPEALQGLVDGYVARIDASARRDEKLWGHAYRTYSGWSQRMDFTTYEQEIAYVRAWLSQRWQTQDSIY